MSLRDRLVLRGVQYQVHRKVKKGEDFNLEELYSLEDRDFSFGGFLLGFFLGLIGLLIALLFGRNAVRSALYGMICNAIIILIGIAGWIINNETFQPHKIVTTDLPSVGKQKIPEGTVVWRSFFCV